MELTKSNLLSAVETINSYSIHLRDVLVPDTYGNWLRHTWYIAYIVVSSWQFQIFLLRHVPTYVSVHLRVESVAMPQQMFTTPLPHHNIKRSYFAYDGWSILLRLTQKLLPGTWQRRGILNQHCHVWNEVSIALALHFCCRHVFVSSPYYW